MASHSLLPSQHFFCFCSLLLPLQDETLPRPSDEEFVEAWSAIITATNDDITTATTTEDNTTATTEDVTTTTTDDITAPTATAATLPAPAATTMLPATTTDSLPALCSSCLVDEAAAAGPANTLPATNTTITAVAVDSKPAPVGAELAAATVFLYVEAGSSRCSSSDGAADSPGYPCMLQHDLADAAAAENYGSHTLALAAAAAAAAKGKLHLLLQQLPAECDTAATLAGLADSASSLQQLSVQPHSLHAAATAGAATVVDGKQGSKASAGWLRRVCSRLFACGFSSSLCMVDGV
jgi:hypothetical protein